jgi:aerobic-type carbon monoxide dehydrogenase small subunit (CoxS/CutS family)
MSRVTEIQVNGTRRRIDADAERTLLSALRDDLDLTGTKYGCGEGQCGACTVLLDGLAAHACRVTVRSAAARQITTIEGLAKDGKLHPLQEAFIELGALQCGYCTPGMIVAGAGLLRTNPHPSADEIVRHMQGHICRCGTYPRIVAAIQLAARKMGRP